MRFEVFTSVKISIMVFGVANLCSLIHFHRRFGEAYCNVEAYPEDGGDNILRNDGNILKVYTASQTIIPQPTIFDFAV